MINFFKNWNWGKGIAVAIVTMCLGILTVVYIATTYNYDMVIDNYYEEELKFNDQALAINNAQQLSEQLSIAQESKYLMIAFPTACANKNLKGTLQLYRPSDADKDITMPIKFVSETVMSVPLTETIKGNYIAIAQWEMDGKQYKVVKNFEVL